MPTSRTRTSAHPSRNFGTGFEVAFKFPFTVRKESTGLSSSFSFYLYGIAILPAELSGPARPFFQSDRTWPPAAPTGDRGLCSRLPDASLVPSALPSGLRSARSFGWLQPPPAPSSHAIPAVFQNAADVRDGFVQILDHSVRGMICRFCQAAQLRFVLHRQVQVKIHPNAHIFRQRISRPLAPAAQGD